MEDVSGSFVETMYDFFIEALMLIDPRVFAGYLILH